MKRIHAVRLCRLNVLDLNEEQKRLMAIALKDPATSKFLELKQQRGEAPSPKNSLDPQMSKAFSALGIAGAAGIMQRGQIRQQLNEINENLDEIPSGDASGGDAGGDFSGFWG